MKQQPCYKCEGMLENKLFKWLFLIPLFTLCTSGLVAQTTGSYSISNNGATGVNAQKTQLLDFTNYNNTTASTSAGQSFVFTLANGYKLSLTAKNIGATYLAAAACPILSSPYTALGYSGYAGLSGKPALYMNNNYNVDIVFSSITLTDANGNTIPNFTMALFDAERTGTSTVTETITGITNGGNWAAYESLGTGTFPTQTGIGTSTVVWTANTGTPVAAYAASTTNPTQVEVKMYGYEGFALGIYIPMGFVYVHQQHINEENAVDYSFTLNNSSGTTINTFSLNDQATADNVAYSGSYVHAIDLGVGHGPGGDGELWAAASATTSNGTAPGLSGTGTLYRRSPGSTKWSALSPTGVIAVDGAYAGQCVYATSAGVYFYNNGTSTQIYSSTTVTDVTCNNGYIAVVAGNTIYTYANNYTPSSAPAAGGTWTSILSSGTGTRIDMNIAATKIFFLQNGTNKVYYTNFSGTYTSIGTAGSSVTLGTYDVACDDNGNVYATCYDNSNGGTNVVASYSASTTAWTTETPSRNVQRLTGGAAAQVYGVEITGGSGYPQTIWLRATDNTGTAFWVDDERIKNSATLNGNGLIIPVPVGTFTVNQTLPSTSYDLGRFNIYDPGNATTTNLVTNYASATVTAGEVLYIEFVNEKLNPKAIALNCTQQTLQSFDPADYGSGIYGYPSVEGTAYHYYVPGSGPANDGFYFLIQSTNTASWYSTPGITDHTGNGGYFLAVNASYGKDEFYRQRVTNLVPGLSYKIQFYAANLSSASPVTPNVTYGLQDLSGNLVNTATTGNLPTDNNWHLFSFTFTATTSTADLYLKNLNIGGNGNDIGIDDISINPVIIPLTANIISPAVAPNICLGTNYTFSNTQSGGIWSLSPTTVAKINAKTGKAIGISSGNAIVTYTYTNAIGCVSTATTGIIVSIPPAIVVTDQLATGTVCLTQADSLYSSATGGTLPFTYAWSASPSSGAGLTSTTTQNTSIAATGSNTYTYTVVVTDAVGCTGTGSTPLTVSTHTAPSVTTTGPNTCLGLPIANLKAIPTGGSGSYTYAWSGTPSATNGLSVANNTLQSPNPTPTAAGSYTFTVIVNDGFCTVVPTAQAVTIYPVPSVVTSNDTSEYVCANPSFVVKSTPSGGTSPYTYSWSGAYVSGPDNGPGVQSPTNQQNVTVKPTLTLSSALSQDKNKYTVLVTDAKGCTATGATNITAYQFAGLNSATVSVTPSTAQTVCSGSTITLGSAVSGGSTPYTYSWSGPGSYTSSAASPGAITPTASGSYTLQVVTAQGCVSSSATATITVNQSPTVSASSYTPSLCYNAVDTVYSAASGGTSPYTYQWTVTGTSPIMTIAAPTSASSSVSGGNFGSTYTYTITAKDANNCTATNTTTVRSVSGNVNATGPTISNMPSAGVACLNTAKTLSPTATQGNGAITTYLWTGTPTGNGLGATNTLSTTITPTAVGSYTYTLKVTDANGCAASATTGIQTVNSAIAVTVASAAPAFCGSSGSLALFSSASGGSGTYSNYAWSASVVTSPGSTTVSPTSSTTSGSTTATISGATIGTSTFKYTATVTDNNGCTGSSSSSILVTGSTPVIGTVSASSNSTCAGNATVVTLSATYSGGIAPYNYTWTAPSNSTVTPAYGDSSTSPVSGTATATAAQNYTWGFAVEDANNCTATGSTTTLALNAALTIAAAASSYSVCQTPATNINLTGSYTATSGPYSYAWSGSGVTIANTQNTTATPTASGVYTFTITDGTGCIGSATTPSTIVVDQATPSISLTCGTNGNGIAYGRLFEANGTSWNWTTTSGGRFYPDNTLSTSNDASTSANQSTYITYNGIYSVKITDAAGCTGTGNYTVTSSSCAVTLAVTELNFTAQKQFSEALLAWHTATETNNSHFVIERSADATTWQAIATVKGVGNSTVLTQYSYVDVQPLGGTNYYRVKQVDNNGQFVYSVVRTINFYSLWSVKLYPNPAQNFLLLHFNNSKDEKAYVQVQDAFGRTVIGSSQQITKGANLVTINGLENLAKGTYVITMHTADNIFRSKFVRGGN